MDLSGHAADLLLDQVVLGKVNSNHADTGTLLFDTGTLNATSPSVISVMTQAEDAVARSWD